MSDESSKENLGILDVLTKKDVTEAIFKNLTWYLACGALLKFTIGVGPSGNWLLVLLMFMMFIFLFTLNLAFGVNHILMPIDAGLGRTLDQLREQNAADQSDITKFKRTFGFLLCSIKGWAYLLLSCAYVAAAFQLVEQAAKTLPGGEKPKIVESAQTVTPGTEKPLKKHHPSS